MTAISAERREIDALLEERARRLARPVIEVSEVPSAEFIAFGTGSERYALDVAFVHRLERCTRVTPVPGSARFFAGITNFHGQLVPLIDLGLLLDTTPCMNPAFVIVLGELRAEIGIVAEELLELLRLPLHAFGTPGPAPRPLVRHITAGGIAVIDAATVIAVATNEEPPR